MIGLNHRWGFVPRAVPNGLSVGSMMPDWAVLGRVVSMRARQNSRSSVQGEGGRDPAVMPAVIAHAVSSAEPATIFAFIGISFPRF